MFLAGVTAEVGQQLCSTPKMPRGDPEAHLKSVLKKEIPCGLYGYTL